MARSGEAGEAIPIRTDQSPCLGEGHPLSPCTPVIVSRTHRFAFIHIPKTGGCSVREGLRPLLGEGDRICAWPDGGANLQHADVRETRAALRFARLCGVDMPAWEDLFTFAFVRNPWDAAVSQYHHLRRSASGRTHPEAHRVAASKPFDEWLHWHYAARPQADWLTAPGGELLVDFVGRFERLRRDFAAALDRLGLRADLPRHNVGTPHRRYAHYTDYYDPASRRLVERIHARDIEMFGYRFEDGTRGRAVSIPDGEADRGMQAVGVE